MLAKIIGAIAAGIGGLAIIFILALIGTVFLYAGWNWGVAHAIPSLARPIDLVTTFWFSLGLSAIGSRFQSTLSTK